MPAITVEDTLVLARIPRPDPVTRSRPVAKVVTSRREAEGAGFVVARPFPGDFSLAEADPFLLLDHVGPQVNGPARPRELRGTPTAASRPSATSSTVRSPTTIPTAAVASSPRGTPSG